MVLWGLSIWLRDGSFDVVRFVEWWFSRALLFYCVAGFGCLLSVVWAKRDNLTELSYISTRNLLLQSSSSSSPRDVMMSKS